MVADEEMGRADDELIGTTLSSCAIVTLLGEGGMARVYRARQQHLDRDVALKVLPPYYATDPAFVERFKLEARAMASLTHAHIIIVHDAGADQGRLFIVMEYVPGGSLRQRLERGMSLREVTRIVGEVSAALDYAHAHSIIHRDVKPANVLLDSDGRAVLSDFGIAKVLATSTVLTRTGAGVGTPEYMSPEQCQGGVVDARSDIYALGVMLYEMLTGHTPFESENYTALAHAHVYEPVPPPSRRNPRISPAVQAVVLKTLEKDPEHRFQRAGEMAQALVEAVEAQQPLSPRPPPPTGAAPATPGAGRHAPAAGTPVAPQVLCPRCHSRNSARQRFCSSCGQPFGAMGSAAHGAAVPAGVSQVAQGTTAHVSCPHCHALNRGYHHYCTTCGRPLPAPATLSCPACGARNAPSVRYCTSCGASLA